MIVHNVVQGSADWLRLRAGIPTASQFHRVITPKTRKRSAQIEQYARELAAERLLGLPLDIIPTAAMTDGTEREAQAVASYELTRWIDTKPVGFVTTDDAQFGASPDRIWAGFERLVETKNPRAATHIGYLLGDGPDDDYRCQLQGQLFVCEAKAVDIISCYPGLPDIVVTVERDEEFIATLIPLLGELNALVVAHMATLAKLGYEPPAVLEERDYSQDFISDADVDRIVEAQR